MAKASIAQWHQWERKLKHGGISCIFMKACERRNSEEGVASCVSGRKKKKKARRGKKRRRRRRIARRKYRRKAYQRNVISSAYVKENGSGISWQSV